MNTRKTYSAKNREAWKNAVLHVLQKANLDGIQCEIEPGLIVEPLYSADNAAASLTLPVDHIESPPDVILNTSPENLLDVTAKFLHLAVEKLHITVNSRVEVERLNEVSLKEVSYQIQFRTHDLITETNPAILTRASAVFCEEKAPIRTNGWVFSLKPQYYPSIQLTKVIRALIDVAEGATDPDISSWHVLIEIGRNYALEISKLRALHLLIDHLWDHNTFNNSGLPKPTIQALCAVEGYQADLPEKGLIEMTTKCMAASAGMVQGLVLKPPSKDFHNANILYGYAMIPQILRHECGWYQVADPMAGSYWIETVTAKIAERTWEQIGKVKRGN